MSSSAGAQACPLHGGLCAVQAPKGRLHIFECPFSAQVWSTLSINTAGCMVSHLWALERPGTVPHKHFDTLILLICWQLWKHRNGAVFEQLSPSAPRFWRACRQEAALWSCRLPPADRSTAHTWCDLFPPV
ncbi:unnamed protein product [Urochloa humidicola]